MKTSLSTSQTTGQTIEDLLLNFRSQPIGPHMPSLREILHNHAEERPERSSHPVDLEQVCNYLMDRKGAQKQNHNRSHNVRPLSELHPGQEVLFLSPSEPHDYIEGSYSKSIHTQKLPNRSLRQDLPPNP